jgi:PPIC-type PPIASE domain
MPFMNLKFASAAVVLAAIQGCALAAPKEELPPDAVLLENGPAKVTVQDFDAAMTRFPKNLREEARAYPGVILKNLDALFVNRVAAEHAMQAGLDKDPLVQQRMKQLQEGYLAQKYLDHLYETVKVPDLTLRAEEIYQAEPKRWMDPATATLDDLVINLIGRTPEMALQRAQEAEQRLRAGEDFLAVGALYSDDRNFAKSHGELGLVRLPDLEEPLRKAVEGLKAGDISAPIATPNAVHILRVREKRPPRQRSFAEVKPFIVAEEDERIRKKATEDFISEVRNSPQNIVHRDRLEALRSDIDLSKIGTAKQQAIEAAQSQSAQQAR